ncbi:ArsC/Spx/MgsR family protein [Waltera sp.]|jgi:Spx/MgsR family transcriptional regulator|uniref:ArsC/Spx/MgsR family protein n=2 Tax=Waltera sp. TaxID=2815806 RepID=UPI000E46BFDF|nr:NUDIX domain-containing protein [Firmicutes bacterium AF22-6AC]
MDILFKNDDFVFSYRVGGILIHNEKILLQRPKNDDYAIIGGHVAAMETSMETLKREFEEELHAEIEVDNLLAIGEIYFPWGKRPCHQICLYYNVHLLDDSIPMDGVFHGYDELDHERINLDFCWIPLEEHNITYTDRHIVEDNPTYEELKEWQSRSGLPLKKFFNTSGLLYKNMQLKDKLPNMTEEEQLRLLATDGMLVKRPFVVDGDLVLTGFREAEWKEKLI